MNPHNNEKVKAKRGTARSRVLWVGVILAGLVGAVAIGGAAVSTHAKVTGWSHGGHGHGQFLQDPALAREHAEFATSWVLGRVDASDEQEDQVKAIIGASVDDLALLAQQHQQNRDAWTAELSKPTIDRAALEQLRQNGLALADEATGRLVQALADAAEVLTPDQRAELIEMAERFHHR